MTLEQLYAQHCASGRAIAAHLPRLRALAESCDSAVEFGVKKGASSTALLRGMARGPRSMWGRLISFDIVETREARALQALAGDQWRYCLQDSRTALFPDPDLLFIDAQHDYSHVKAELDAHADRVRRYLVFHDTITFGSIGARGESGEQLWTYQTGQSVPTAALGIRPAIDELMIRDASWRIVAHYTDSHGLLVLERRS